MKSMYKKFLSLSIMTGIMLSSKAFATPILGQDFFDACQTNNLEAVKRLVAEEENSQQDLNAPSAHFESPLAVAAHYKSHDILSYLINHPGIDINKDITHFRIGCMAPEDLKLPLFFGLLYNNDYNSLELLLNSPKFDVSTLDRGLDLLFKRYPMQLKLDSETVNVLRSSAYSDRFEDLFHRVEESRAQSLRERLLACTTGKLPVVCVYMPSGCVYMTGGLKFIGYDFYRTKKVIFKNHLAGNGLKY